ncbi:MAG: lipid-A-disaccharide synthase [Chlamydiota bacterium]
MNEIDLFIIAGEASGDLQGSHLVQELLRIRPSLKIGAVAGPLMRTLKIKPLFRMEDLQVMGFIDVLLALPQIYRQFKAIREKILELSPKAVLCIDYPGFNLRMQRSLRKKGYRGKLIHFVCPTVWAWGKKRIPLMAKNLDLLLTLFPFEKACFSHTSLPVAYVGNPIAAKAAAFIPSKTFRQKYQIGEAQKILSLFPGSRKKEIERNLKVQIETAQEMQALDPTLQITLSIAHSDLEETIRTLAQDLKAIYIRPADTYDLMKASHVSLATSGTVTLELALHGTPTVVNYAIRPLDCFLAQKIFRIHLPFYCIVNIIASERIFPELFGPQLTGEQMFFWTQKLWLDEGERRTVLAGCDKVRKSLGINNAAESAAEKIFSIL